MLRSLDTIDKAGEQGGQKTIPDFERDTNCVGTEVYLRYTFEEKKDRN